MESCIVEKAKKGQFVLIAEIGVNYYDIAKLKNISVLDAAKLMIYEAKKAGVHAVKFQSYKANTLAAKDSPSYWDTTEESTTSQYELFKKFDSFGYKDYKELSEYSNEIGIEFLSTAFDFESADYLDELMNVYKISSSDITNLPFIAYQAKKNKPILLSIGASNKDEVDNALKEIRKYNKQPIVLLHCILEYPTPLEHANLNRIQTLVKEYPNLIIGYSDHTKPEDNCDIIKTAYNMGAIVIEKHYTLDKTLPGNDHYHAMDPQDAKNILNGIEKMDKIRGSYEIKPLESEATSRLNARRSLVSTRKIDEGEIVTEDMLTYKRPGTGISPSKINEIIGKKAKVKISEDIILMKEFFNY